MAIPLVHQLKKWFILDQSWREHTGLWSWRHHGSSGCIVFKINSQLWDMFWFGKNIKFFGSMLSCFRRNANGSGSKFSRGKKWMNLVFLHLLWCSYDQGNANRCLVGGKCALPPRLAAISGGLGEYLAVGFYPWKHKLMRHKQIQQLGGDSFGPS